MRAPALFLTLSLPTPYCATRKALPVYSEIRYPITWFRSMSFQRPRPIMSTMLYPREATPSFTPTLLPSYRVSRQDHVQERHRCLAPKQEQEELDALHWVSTPVQERSTCEFFSPTPTGGHRLEYQGN